MTAETEYLDIAVTQKVTGHDNFKHISTRLVTKEVVEVADVMAEDVLWGGGDDCGCDGNGDDGCGCSEGVEMMTDGNGYDGCGCDGADKDEAEKLRKRHNHRYKQIKLLHH